MEEEIRHQKPHKNSEITLRKEDEEKIINEVIKNMISKFTEEEKESLEKLFTKINKEPLEKPLQPHDHIKPHERKDKIAPHDELEHHHVKPHEKKDKIAPHNEFEHLELMIDLCENKNELIRILTDINRLLLDSCKNQYHVNVKKRK